MSLFLPAAFSSETDFRVQIIVYYCLRCPILKLDLHPCCLEFKICCKMFSFKFYFVVESLRVEQISCSQWRIYAV